MTNSSNENSELDDARASVQSLNNEPSSKDIAVEPFEIGKEEINQLAPEADQKTHLQDGVRFQSDSMPSLAEPLSDFDFEYDFEYYETDDKDDQEHWNESFDDLPISYEAVENKDEVIGYNVLLVTKSYGSDISWKIQKKDS